jgi:hypothetical protein
VATLPDGTRLGFYRNQVLVLQPRALPQILTPEGLREMPPEEAAAILADAAG